MILADQFAELFDVFLSRSNDLTQLTMGVDRDNHTVAHVYDENNDAVKLMIREAVRVAKAKGVKIGLCDRHHQTTRILPDSLSKQV